MSYSKPAPFVIAAAVLLTLSGGTIAQRNNPFSENPDARTAVASAKRLEVPIVRQSAQVASQPAVAEVTQIYKIGAGDTLQIVLANAPNASGYYSVQADGTVDFPLAGDAPRVGGLTCGEIERQLSSRIKLYSDPQVHVQVREFGSHKINVSGLVERNGERYLQREAMPLFTIKADVGVKADAGRAIIRRTSGASETYKLDDIRTDDVLITSGDSVEFAK
jgi:protein involved in polysaccharide export with SLBB domain